MATAEKEIHYSASNPGVNDDITADFVNGSKWCNTTTKAVWECSDNAVGAAVWYCISNIFGTTAGKVCEGNDARLSDARTPTAHSHTLADVTDSGDAAARNTGMGSGNVVKVGPGGLSVSQVMVTNGAGNAETEAKGTAFNKAFGTTAGTVAEGNHTHVVASGDATFEDFTQASHGFAVGDVIRYASGSWTKALADTGDNSEALGVVSAVPNANDFTIVYSGRITGLTGLTADSIHFLSGSVAGDLTATEPSISKPMLFATSTTEGVVLVMRAMSSTALTKTWFQGHTYAISGEVKVPSGDSDFIIPFYVCLAPGQTAKLARARYSINSGTSVTCKLQKNGGDVTGFTGMTVTTTPTNTDPADVTLADCDKLALVVTGVAGTPKNLSFTITLEMSV